MKMRRSFRPFFSWADAKPRLPLGLAVVGAGLLLALTAQLAHADAGGPDAYGYIFEDSDEPSGPVYDFEDISATGTVLALGETMTATVPMSFSFSFYGSDFSEVYVCSDGYLSFDAQALCHPLADPIPSTSTPNGGLIAGWWNDLSPQDGAVHYQTLGAAPYRRLIVQFTDVPHFSDGPLVTMQFKLFEQTNIIEVHYQAAPGDGPGDYHTAGIENQAGTEGLQYHYNSSSLDTPLAVRYWVPSFEFVKTVNDFSPLAGQRITYTLSVYNFRTSHYTGAVISDTLSNDLTFAGPVTVQPAGAGTPGTAPPVLVSGLTVSFARRVTVTFPVTVNPGVVGPVYNTAYMSSSEVITPFVSTVGIRAITCQVQVEGEPAVYDTVQEAVDVAGPGDLVKIAGYCADINAHGGLAQLVYLDKDVTLRGGYSLDLADWNPDLYPTTLDAYGHGRVVYVTNPPTLRAACAARQCRWALGAPGEPQDKSGTVAPRIEALRLTGGNAGTLGGGPVNEDAGGAVFSLDAAPTVSRCQIFSSTAAFGGGLFLHDSAATVTSSLIFSNTATAGGGLYLYRSDAATLVGNTVSDNTSGEHGGGLYLGHSGATLTNNTVTRNSASLSGGGLYLDNSGTQIQGGAVFSNTAADGGGLYLDTSSAGLDSNAVYFNTATQSGGGLYIISGTATISGCEIFTNTAVAGGGLYLDTSAAHVVANMVYSNAATQSGGGLFLFGSDNVTLTANIVTDNQSQNHGGGLFLENSATALDGNTIAANTAGQQGGGLYLSLSDARLTANTVSSNTATDSGGGLRLYESDGAILDGNNVSSNSSVKYGGGLYLELCDARLTDNVISYNSADQAGGGLFLTISPATLIANTVLSNTSAAQGGGLYLHNSGAVISDNLVIANSAHGDGGGLHLYESQAELDANTVAENVSDETGGGLYLQASAATLNRNVIQSNQARFGGGLNIEDDAPVLDSNVILANTGTTWGGGVALAGGAVTLTNNIVADNQSPSSSGLIVKGGLHHLTHNTFARNGFDDPTTYDSVGVRVAVGETVLSNTILVSHSIGIHVETGYTATLTATLWGNVTDWVGEGHIVTGALNYWGDPAFLYPDAGDYHILASSAALDKGVDAAVYSDIDGENRPSAVSFDLGADEYFTRPELVVSQQAIPNPVHAGTSLTFTLRVTNTGNVPLTATITDVAPDHVTPEHDRLWTAALPLPIGAWTGQFSVTVDASFRGTLFNRVEVTTTQGATGTTTLALTVNALADLVVSKEVNKATPMENETVVYSLQVTNQGPSDATGVVIRDDLPDGVHYVADDGGGAFDSVIGYWTVGWLPVSASAALNITVTVEPGTAGTAITNTATVFGVYEADMDSENNHADAVLTVGEERQIWVFLPVMLKSD